MTRVLPPLHEGHAPIVLHQAFDDALEAYENWAPAYEEPLVDLDGKPIPISSLFGRMRTCTDVVPLRVLDTVKDVAAPHADGFGDANIPYAQLAFLMRALCRDKLRAA